MDKLKKEALIDELLIFMNEEIEKSGNIISCVRFDFNEQGEDAISFMKVSNFSYEEVVSALNTCRSRKYITHRVLGGGKYSNLELTEEGQGRAISVEAAKYAPPKHEPTGINIGAIHASGPTQIGNYNTQNIEILFSTIIEKIDQTNASDNEKKDAKSRLKAFLEHPLTNTALGLTPTIVQSIFGAR